MIRYNSGKPEADIHPQDVYTPEAHFENVSLVEDYLVALGTENEDDCVFSTPWMITDSGLAKVDLNHENQTVRMVEEMPDGFFGLPTHFVKHTVELDGRGFNSGTKLYMRIRQHLGILINTPISAGMMMGYPTIEYPEATTKALERHLSSPEEQIEARVERLQGLFATRPRVLRHWVGVKLD